MAFIERDDFENYAAEYIDEGLHLLPVHPTQKRPLLSSLADIRANQADLDTVMGWYDQFKGEVGIGIFTGPESGLVVLDLDTEVALALAQHMGIADSDWMVETQSGNLHVYFRHPGGEVRTLAGSAFTGRQNHEWPRVKGFDLRGDKNGYVVAPPSAGYRWLARSSMVESLSKWPGYQYHESHLAFFDPIAESEVKRSAAIADWTDDPKSWDLSAISELSASGAAAIYHATECIAKQFPMGKLPTGGGNGRDMRTYSYMGALARDGLTRQEIEDKARDFMEALFVDPLPERKFLQMCERIVKTEMAAQEERDRTQNALDSLSQPSQSAVEDDAFSDELPEDDRDDAKWGISPEDFDWWQTNTPPPQAMPLDPLIRFGEASMLTGKPGSGKSFLLLNALLNAATKPHDMVKRVGPFTSEVSPRVLYLDPENGHALIMERMEKVPNVDQVGDRVQVIPAKVYNPKTGKWLDGSLDLYTPEGLETLDFLIRRYDANVIVIDTVRSCFPGMEENSAESWKPFNDLVSALTSAGKAVVAVHHSPKTRIGPAGSTAAEKNMTTILHVEKIEADPDLAEYLDLKKPETFKHYDPMESSGNKFVEALSTMETRANMHDMTLRYAAQLVVVKNRMGNPNATRSLYAGFSTNDLKKTDTNLYLGGLPSPRQAAELMITNKIKMDEVLERLTPLGVTHSTLVRWGLVSEGA